MLETVTSIDASVTRVAAPPAAKAGSVELSAPPKITEIKPPYVSPAVRVDPLAQQVILEFRDSESGEVLKQIPSERQIQAYSPAETVEVSDDSPATTSTSSSDFVSVDISIDTPTAPSVDTANRTPSAGSLGPSVPLGNGDTSSFAV